MHTSAPKPYGFTLIEILVVVLVISILMGVVVSSFSGVDREQTFRGYAERLGLRIEIARDKAMQANREWGVYLDKEGVRFSEFDEINQEWITRGEKPFTPDNFDAEVQFAVEVEEIPGALDQQADVDDEDLPSIVLFSSGETTPFEITIEPLDWQAAPWLLTSDGFTRTSVTRGDAQ